MTPSAKALADYMSTLSESAYHAGWMSGLEYDLWKAIIDGPRRYGILDITSEHITQLQRLSSACNGWICFDDKTEETFIEINDWIERYSRYEGRSSGEG